MSTRSNSILELARNRRRPIILSVTGLLALAMVAYASIPDENGVIYGCYKKSGGTIRVIDNSVTNCTKDETLISWNRQGPAGPQGPQGEQGPQGPAGTPGISSATFEFASSPVPVGSDWTLVLSKNLPPGNWVVVANASVGSTPGNSDVAGGQCELRNGLDSIGGSGWSAFISEDWSGSWLVSMNGGAALPAGGVVSLWCRSLLGEDSQVYGRQMMILQVGSFF